MATILETNAGLPHMLPAESAEKEPAVATQPPLGKSGKSHRGAKKKDRVIDLNDPKNDAVEARVRSVLEQFDKDRNGQFSYEEVVDLVKAFLTEKKRAKTGRRLAAGGMLLGMCGFLAAIAAAVLGNVAVQSSVAEPTGEMISQPSGGLFPGEGQPVTVGAAEQQFELSSVLGMEDDELMNLRNFMVTHAGVQYYVQPALVMRNDGEGFVQVVGSAGMHIRVTSGNETLLKLLGSSEWVRAIDDEETLTHDEEAMPDEEDDEEEESGADAAGEGRRLAARRRASSSSSARRRSVGVSSSGRRRQQSTTVVVTSRRRRHSDVIVVGDASRRRYHEYREVHHHDGGPGETTGTSWGFVVTTVLVVLLIILILCYCNSGGDDKVYVHGDVSCGSSGSSCDVVVVHHH